MAVRSHGRGLRPLPARRGRPAQDVSRDWLALAEGAARAARDWDDEDAAFELAGLRSAVLGRPMPTLGNARGNAGRALVELTADWSRRGGEARRQFAATVLVLAELCRDLVEELRLGEAAHARRMCGEE